MDRRCVFFLDYLPSTPSFSWLSGGISDLILLTTPASCKLSCPPLWVANCVGCWLGAEAPSPGCTPWPHFPERAAGSLCGSICHL